MITKYIGCLLLGLGLLNLALAADLNIGRIVGGELTDISKHPYLVQVLVSGHFACGGAILSDMFVISAAHCFVQTKPADVMIVAGATKLSDTGIRRKVQNVFVPNLFSLNTMNMDVAILKLAQPISGPNVGKIALYTGALSPGLTVQVSGWGRISESGDISNQVRTVAVPIIKKAFCTERYANFVSLTGSMFCASKSGVKDSCSGDSGGPAVCKGQLCGVVSFGIGCARPGYPGVYTSTKAVQAFIENSMKK